MSNAYGGCKVQKTTTQFHAINLKSINKIFHVYKISLGMHALREEVVFCPRDG